MPVRVLHTSELFHHPLPGGLMQFYNYAPGLAQRGVQMQMLTLRTRPDLASQEDMNGIAARRLEPPDDLAGGSLRGIHRQRQRLLREALQVCSAENTGPQVLQPNALSWLMWPQLLRARQRGIPVVHNVMIAPESPPAAGAIAAARHWLMMKLTFGLVPRVVMLSSALARTCQQHYHLRADQVRVIPNGVDVRRFQPAVDSAARTLLREQLHLPPGARVVLFVGGVMPRKGVDLLLRAWNAVSERDPEALLLVVGSNGPRDSHQSGALSAELRGYMATLDTLRANLKHPASVRFVGEVSDPVPYFQAADLFAFPSHREGLPNAMLEAMASGLPALTTSFIGLPAPGEELGHPGQHFLLLEREADVWSRTLVDMLSPAASARRVEMGQAARAWVCATNHLERTLDLWAGLYHSLAASSQTSPSPSHGSDFS